MKNEAWESEKTLNNNNNLIIYIQLYGSLETHSSSITISLHFQLLNNSEFGRYCHFNNLSSLYFSFLFSSLLSCLTKDISCGHYYSLLLLLTFSTLPLKKIKLYYFLGQGGGSNYRRDSQLASLSALFQVIFFSSLFK